MRRRVLMLSAVGLSAALSIAAFKGGWAIVSFNDVPESAAVGSQVELSYMVRQHGAALTNGLTGELVLKNGSHSTTVPAVNVGAGRYVARVVFPSAGSWTVRANSGFGPAEASFPMTVTSANAPARTMPAAERGRQLFLAKGCATCHSHVAARTDYKLDMGPDLSEPKFAAAYLAKFIADPSIKTDWKTSARMPNIGLKPAEIAAVVAFLTEQPASGSRR